VSTVGYKTPEWDNFFKHDNTNLTVIDTCKDVDVIDKIDTDPQTVHYNDGGVPEDVLVLDPMGEIGLIKQVPPDPYADLKLVGRDGFKISATGLEKIERNCCEGKRVTLKENIQMEPDDLHYVILSRPIYSEVPANTAASCPCYDGDGELHCNDLAESTGSRTLQPCYTRAIRLRRRLCVACKL